MVQFFCRRRKGNLVHLDQLMDLRVLVVIVSLRLQLQRIKLLLLVGAGSKSSPDAGSGSLQEVYGCRAPTPYISKGKGQRVLRFLMVQRRVILFIRLQLLLL